MSRPPALKAGERVFHLLLLAFSLGVLHQAWRIDGLALLNSPGAFPLLLAGVMVLSMLVILLKDRRRPGEAQGPGEAARLFTRRCLPPALAVILLLSVLYLTLLRPLGFVAATLLFLFTAQLYLRRGRPVSTLLISVGMTAAVYGLFQLVFQVYLP